jgi:pSer/pThr/pTyr-binding forkhead associated (FHA) protein
VLMVRDLGSLNGTFLGEQRVEHDALPLTSGDLLTVGGVTFRALYQSDRAERHQVAPWDPQGPTLEADPPPTKDAARKKQPRGENRDIDGDDTLRQPKRK